MTKGNHRNGNTLKGADNMARNKSDRNEPRDDVRNRDKTRDRNGWKAQRSAARRAKATRRTLESGDN
jgi:hypothetical protein